MGSSSLVLQEAQSGISSGAKIPAKRSALKPYGQIWGRFPTSNMCQLRGLGAPNRLVGQCGPPVSAPDGPTSAAEKAAWKHSHLTLQIDWNPVVNISHKIRTIRAAVQRRCAPTRSGCKYSMRLQLSNHPWYRSSRQPSVMPRSSLEENTPFVTNYTAKAPWNTNVPRL